MQRLNYFNKRVGPP